jgi:hypothetical protein
MTTKKKSFRVTIKNIYGLPFFNDKVDAYAKQLGADVVFGVTSLKDPVNRKKKFLLVIANLAFLSSAKIPVLGYRQMENGLFVKTSFPASLAENEVSVFGPTYKFPSSEQLRTFYETGSVEGIENKRFLRYLSLEEGSLDSRVFGKGKA